MVKEGLLRSWKKCRQYLHHTQKSVFESEIFVSKLEELKQSIGRLINPEEDYVVIYKLENKNNLKEKALE